jgi:hypothetical protein
MAQSQRFMEMGDDMVDGAIDPFDISRRRG